MSECVIVTAYQRPELLSRTIARIKGADKFAQVYIWGDRGTSKLGVPKHGFYGNTYNTMEALRWASEAGFDYVYLIEDDVFVYPDFFAWHRRAHLDDDIFASCAWTFNRHAPIADGGDMWAPWYYSIGVCFAAAKLRLITRHANISYYSDMSGYIRDTFPNSILNVGDMAAHWEQDGLIQRVMEADGSQVCWPSLPKCAHMGWSGYNKPNGPKILTADTFEERCEQIEAFYANSEYRAKVFGEDIVRREEAGAGRGHFETYKEWQLVKDSGTVGRAFTKKQPDLPAPWHLLGERTNFKMLHEAQL